MPFPQTATARQSLVQFEENLERGFDYVELTVEAEAGADAGGFRGSFLIEPAAIAAEGAGS